MFFGGQARLMSAERRWTVMAMAKKHKGCKFCDEKPARQLKPMENGPMWGLKLERGSDDYCTHECWESDLQFATKSKED